MVSRKRIGRPPLPEEQRQVSLYVGVPGRVHRKLNELAERRGLTVPELVRLAVEKEVERVVEGRT